MTGRRLWILVVLTLMAASCGDDGTTTDTATDTAAGDVTVDVTDAPEEADATPVVVPVAARLAPAADPNVAGRAIAAFAVDLFRSVRATSEPGANVAVSPASVAFALAMVEPGAVGDAQIQLRSLLHMQDPATFHASMNALQHNLEARLPTTFAPDDDPGEVTVRIANAAYLQKGYPFETAYLDSIGSNYGPVLNEVDFSADPDAVAHQINAFVADTTNDRIPQIVPDGAIDPLTVLALVNALYLKASWLGTFQESSTTEETFTGLDGATQTVNMMHGGSDSSASGDGWVGATKSYTGGLTAQFILPDEGRFDEIAGNVNNAFDEFRYSDSTQSTLGLPRFDLRYGAELSPALQALGLTAPYARGGLLGVANDPDLVIYKVLHETDVAMDEKGTEAAAATVVLAYPVSAGMDPPVPVVLDRPFLYRIIDDLTGATLFIGQVLNPLA